MSFVNRTPRPHSPGPAPVASTIPEQGRVLRWYTIVSLVLIIAVIGGVSLGSVTIAPNTVVSILGSRLFGVIDEPWWPSAQESIVWNVRLPRVLLACAVGAGLAVCGAVLQAMVRNVLADPYLLGISSGASTGAAAAILFGVGGGLGLHALPASAFAGAALAATAVYALSQLGGRSTSIRLVMAGVAVGYVLSAATSILVFSSDSPEGARSVMFWLLGSLTLAQWDPTLLVVCVVVALSILTIWVWARRLDTLAIGDETALTLGVSPARFRIHLLVVVSACTGAVVAASGSIGFIGLVIPHLARRFIGASHRRMIPLAALLGATFLVLADIVSRTIWAPRELPIGIVTALIGAPFLILLVRRFHASST